MWRSGLVLFMILSGALAKADPPIADQLVLRLLDSEAVYTVGGLKPISEGFWQTRFPTDVETTAEIEHVRRILAGLPLGKNHVAGVFVFSKPHDGKRFASAFLAHLPSVRALVCRRADVFEPLGIRLDTPPQLVMERIDRAEPAARWRAFGLAFGYPEYAVEFFVGAGESEKKTGKFVERSFVSIPTVESNTGRFVYAVPKGHVERYEDTQLKISASRIFEQYLTLRHRFVREGGDGAVALLREWLNPQVVVTSQSISCIKQPHCSFQRKIIVRRQLSFRGN